MGKEEDMKYFDWYEFAGIVCPGALFLLFLGATIPLPDWVTSTGVSIGELGVFVIAAYAVGHMVQALGNMLESAWWKAWGGNPSVRFLKNPDRMLDSSQVRILQEGIATHLGIQSGSPGGRTNRQSQSIIRQVYAFLCANGRAVRVDAFNRVYGLNRGISAALLVGTLLSIAAGKLSWVTGALCGCGAILAWYRMHRFADYYARELFGQFIQLTHDRNVIGGPHGHND